MALFARAVDFDHPVENYLRVFLIHSILFISICGLAASWNLLVTGYTMFRGKGKGKGKMRGPNSGADAGKLHFVSSNTSSGTALRVRDADDLSRRPTAPDVNRMKMPKNIQTQVHWFSSGWSKSTALANNAITEFNQSFALGDIQPAASLVALFDQYAIFAVYARIIVQTTAPIATTIPVYTTALDFDNITNIANQLTLRGYSTSVTSPIGTVQERYIEPCNSPALYSGAVFTHFGQSRMWVDCANFTTPHYGLRLIVAPLGAAVTGSIDVELTYVVCCRNVL